MGTILGVSVVYGPRAIIMLPYFHRKEAFALDYISVSPAIFVINSRLLLPKTFAVHLNNPPPFLDIILPSTKGVVS